MQFIDLNAQQALLRPEIDRRIAAVLEHGQYIMGPEVRELEERLEAFVGTPHCIGVSNGTDALQIALMALGVGPADEVITSAFSFVAAAEVIAMVRATPVFVDIDPSTFNLAPERLEAAISARTKAIIPIDLFGQCADYDAITEIADRYGVPVVQDAAQSLGATYCGRNAGTFGAIACTSFFPSKPLGAYGDAGACFTSDAALAERMRRIRIHGQDRRYHHALLGLNGRLDTLQAAILLAKLDIFPGEITQRARIAGRYDSHLAGMTGVRIPELAPGYSSTFAQYTILVDDRADLQAALARAEIPTTVHYPIPLSRQPLFAANVDADAFPASDYAADHVLSLPMHPYLDEAEQDKVIGAIRDFFDGR